MKLVKLETLEPGTRFRYPDSGKTGVLVSHGVMGERVLFDGSKRQVSFTPKAGDEELDAVEFETPGRPTIVSSGSEVEVL